MLRNVLMKTILGKANDKPFKPFCYGYLLVFHLLRQSVNTLPRKVHLLTIKRPLRALFKKLSDVLVGITEQIFNKFVLDFKFLRLSAPSTAIMVP